MPELRFLLRFLTMTDLELVNPPREVTINRNSAAQADGGLSQLGYAQELFRSMGGFSNFALAFSVVSVLTGAITLYDYGLNMGGPAEMTFGWPLVAFFSLFVAASMAELASMLPTAGAMYHWSCKLGNKHWGWFTAWLTIIGYITAIAGVDYGCAQFITSTFGLSCDPPTITACFALILASHALLNQYGITAVSKINNVSVVVNIVGLIVIIGSLLLFAHKQPLTFLLSTNPLLVPSKNILPVGFILGLLQAQWTLSGYDSSATASEETNNPRVSAPWGIVIAVAGSALVGYLMLIAITLAIQDLPLLLAQHATGQSRPMVVSILIGALGDGAGTFAAWLATTAMWCCGLLAVTACSRTIFAFSRDGGMPLSAVWRSVGRSHSPVAAIWFTVVTAFVCVIVSGNYEIVTSISTVAIYLAYIIPVVLLVRQRQKGLTPGPWNLGKFGMLINLVAIGWTSFISVILCLPFEFRAGKAMVLVLAVLAAAYLISERRRFPGPAWLTGSRTE